MRTFILPLFLVLLTACSVAEPIASSTSVATPTSQPTATAIPSPTATVLPLPTATLEPCSAETANGTKEELVLTLPEEQDHLPTRVNVYLPPCYHSQPERAYPVLYMLHGSSGTRHDWFRLGSAEVADRLMQAGEIDPFIIVMPDSYDFGEVFVDVLRHTLVPAVDATYRTIPSAEARAVAGLSLGGGMSMRAVLQHPDEFSALGAFAPAFRNQHQVPLDAWYDSLPFDQMPAFFMDVGVDDFLLGRAEAIADDLFERRIPFTYMLVDGGHDAAVWRSQLPTYLKWADQQFVSAESTPICTESGTISLVETLPGDINSSVSIYEPPCVESDEPLPVWIFLIDRKGWTSFDVAETADRLIQNGTIPPLLIVMPSAYDSGESFDHWLMEVILPYLEANHNASDRRAISGVSATAGLAARMMMWHPEAFQAVGLHSLVMTGPIQAEWDAAMPSEVAWPAIFLDTGTTDTNATNVAGVHDDLVAQQRLHVYHTDLGGHSPGYWNRQLETYLRWLSAGLIP